jgi:ubiquinone biosynthesis protein
MIPPDLQPTPLVDPAERAPVAVRPIAAPGRWRAVSLARWWLAWLAGEAWRRLLRQRDAGARGRRLRALLERLGGIWIKVGQLLSLRIDLFDVDFCQELATLQDRAYGFPGEVAKARVEAELGMPLDRAFAAFELQPIAAASIGQVHRARLHDGRVVAVKIRRPFIEDALARELALVRFLFRVLDRLRIAPFMRWRNMGWELEEILKEELDYRREASAMQRLRASLNGRGMYVPHVHAEISTASVLVMEYVSGVLMSDYIVSLRADPARVRAWERENQVDPRRVVRRFSQSILRQIIEDNLYHGDLHPGNIVLLRDSRVALLDFGAVGFTERDFLDRFRLFMQAMAHQEYERAADLALLMTSSLPDIDLAPARAEVVRELLAWGLRSGVAALPYPTKSVDAVNVAITRIFFKHRITFEWTFLRIRRALSTMDATAMHLYPEADYTAITTTYFKRAARRTIAKRARPGAAVGALARGAEDEDLVRQIGELGDLALQIERRRLRLAGATLSGAARVVMVSAGWMRLAATAVAVVALIALASQHGPPSLHAAVEWCSLGFADRAPRLDWQIWLAMSAMAGLTVRATARVRAGVRAAAALEGHAG